MPGIYNLDDLSTRVFNDFNHDLRKWTKKIYTNKQIVQLLNTAGTDTDLHVFTPINKPEMISFELMNKNYPNFTHYEIYDVFKRLELRK
jgi:hypothetical protein